MKDTYGRAENYVRISLTDRCNFSCQYCMPSNSVKMMAKREILTFEEIVRLAEISVGLLGVSKIRLTGGEPLVRKGLISLVDQLSSIEGIKHIFMTTNGFLLEEMAPALKNSRLSGLNISLDTLNGEKFREITKIDGLEKVLKGIDVAIEEGFSPIKINAVIRESDDAEIIDLVEFAASKGLVLRFIEQMPFNHQKNYRPAPQIIEILSHYYGKAEAVEALNSTVSTGRGPATYYSFGERALVVGFITPMSKHFCGSCNRLRITADGKLKSCLMSNRELNVKAKMREGASDRDIEALLLSAINLKPERHHVNRGLMTNKRGRSQIGG